MLGLAAAVERPSDHPLAHAIVVAADDRTLATTVATRFVSTTGLRVIADVGGRRVAVCNAAMMASVGADPASIARQSETRRAEGAGVTLVAVDARLAGMLVVTDSICESAKAAVPDLHAEGLRIVMLTGDDRCTAEAVARAISDIDAVHADLRPKDKARIVGDLKHGGR